MIQKRNRLELALVCILSLVIIKIILSITLAPFLHTVLNLFSTL